MTEENQIVVMENSGAVADPMISMIERLVLDPNADMAKLEKMLEMKERIDAKNAEREFAEAFAAFKSEAIKIKKDRTNTHTNSKYATMDAVNAAVDPLLAKHGLSTREPIQEQNESSVTVKCILQHRGGHKEESVMTLPLDITGSGGKTNKTTVQGIGSSTTYARRYAKLAMLGVAPDEDSDGNRDTSGDSVTEFQAKTIADLLAQCPPDVVARFQEAEGVADAKELPKNRYNAACAGLKRAIVETSKPDDKALLAAKAFLAEYVTACASCKTLHDIDGITENEATQKKREALKKYPELDAQAEAAMIDAAKRCGV